MSNHELEVRGLRLVIQHINRVQGHMAAIIDRLVARAAHHDQSKMTDEEMGLVLAKPALDKYEHRSPEEIAALEALRESLAHHYAMNDHHPEHYPNGVDDMSLLSLLEMVCDWKAASEMSPNGNFQKSIEYNRDRFNLSPQLVRILENTGREMGWIPGGES